MADDRGAGERNLKFTVYPEAVGRGRADLRYQREVEARVVRFICPIERPAGRRVGLPRQRDIVAAVLAPVAPADHAARRRGPAASLSRVSTVSASLPSLTFSSATAASRSARPPLGWASGASAKEGFSVLVAMSRWAGAGAAC
eukprot:COSAG06_NODE_1312_length_9891_cov_69.100082_12_plen_143_part_00